MGLLPIAVALILFYAHGAKSGPGLWMALGLGVGLQLMLWSGHALHRSRRGRSKLGDRLVARSDTWFPSFLIVIQGGFTAIILLTFWFTLQELGYRSMIAQYVLIAALLVLLPVRRIVRLKAAEDPTVANEIIYFTLYYCHWILVTLFIATTIQALVFPDQLVSSSFPTGMLFIWIPAVLGIIGSAVLFVDHVIRKLPARANTTKEKDKLD